MDYKEIIAWMRELSNFERLFFLGALAGLTGAFIVRCFWFSPFCFRFSRTISKLHFKAGVVGQKLPDNEADLHKDSKVFKADLANFIFVVYNIENILRIMAEKFINRKIVVEEDKQAFVEDIILKNNILTNDGKKKLKIIKILRDQMIGGSAKNISNKTIQEAFQLAWLFYRELNIWLREYDEKKS